MLAKGFHSYAPHRCFLAIFTSIHFSPLKELWFLSWYLAMKLVFLRLLMVDTWTLTEAKHKEACRPLDIIFFDFLHDFDTFAFGEILAGWPLHGRFTTVPDFLHLYSVELAEVQWRPGAFGMTLEGFPDWQASTSSLWRCYGIAFDCDVTWFSNLCAGGSTLTAKAKVSDPNETGWLPFVWRNWAEE